MTMTPAQSRQPRCAAGRSGRRAACWRCQQPSGGPKQPDAPRGASCHLSASAGASVWPCARGCAAPEGGGGHDGGWLRHTTPRCIFLPCNTFAWIGKSVQGKGLAATILKTRQRACPRRQKCLVPPLLWRHPHTHALPTCHIIQLHAMTRNPDGVPMHACVVMLRYIYAL